jgi:hypothetical protein
MWRRVDLVWTYVSEEHIASIFRVEKSGSCNLQPPAHTGFSFTNFSTLKMEAILSSETSVHTRSTRRHIPEDGILHSHRRENLKSYDCRTIHNAILELCAILFFWTPCASLLTQKKIILISKVAHCQKYFIYLSVFFRMASLEKRDNFGQPCA